MRQDVALPPIAEGVTEAFVVRWLKAVGERIDAGEPLVEMITDKANLEVPSPAGGTIAELCFEEEARVKVGEVLAVLDTESPEAR
jgi:2-oxoglutarate dehydrogenase E2 component (dihydrolipoamide succinyltransferase)